MIDAAERERKIAENLASERRLLAEIQRLTGIVLPRLQWIGTVSAPDRERVQPVVAHLLQDERNPVARGILYAVFGSRAGEDYFESLLGWHQQETEDQGLEVLERCLIVHSGKATRQRLYDCLLLTPARIRLDGIRFLVRKSKTDARLLERIREAYKDCRYDLQVLAVIANMHEADFALIAGDGAANGRLTGRQCTALFNHQLPGSEHFYRRPDLVPYYARILHSSTAPESRLTPTLQRFCAEHGCSADLSGAVLALRKHECVTVSIRVDESSGITRAVILSRLPAAACRPRGGYWFALIEAPIPPPWNLFPKRLLPPDHPARYVRPD